jgi:membrane associated rhomboid family serine protease
VAKFRVSYNAPVVLTFALAAVGVFILTSEHVVPALRLWFVAWPELHDQRSYVGLITHILGHASWNHLLGNFMLILLIGPILEERFGSLRLLVMILITALVTFTSLAYLSMNAHFRTTFATPGESVLGIGMAFVQKYAIPFELASLVLLAALVGAIVIARDQEVD